MGRDWWRIRIRYCREAVLYTWATMILPVRFIFNWWDDK